MATAGTAYRQVLKELEKGKYKPVYYLMGEEAFFIDSIADYIREHALPEEARDFNQLVLYGNETSMNEVVQRARAYPMGSDRQVIIVKEAASDEEGFRVRRQCIGHTQRIPAAASAQHSAGILPQNGSLDKRKKIVAVIEKAGLLFESKKVRDEDLPQFVEEFLNEHGLKMSSKSISMMSESVGADLCRMNGELEKLITALPEGEKEITPEFIEEHVGISKDYNIYEFRDAIINKNILKANKIAAYYENNPKTYPIQLVTAAIFPYFSNLMLAFYAPDKTDSGIAEQLDLKSTWGVRDYTTGMRNYTATQTMQIINAIRRYDGKSKGVDATGNTGEGLLKELLYIILH